MIIYRFSICKCKESFDKCKEKQENLSKNDKSKQEEG